MTPRSIIGLFIAAAFALSGCEAASVSEDAFPTETAGPGSDQRLDLDASFQPTGVVTDAADVFDEEAEQALSDKLEAYNRTARHPMVVASVPSLGGQPMQAFADGLANRWKVGQDDRGVFLLIAPNDRAIWMSVADGSLERLPNERSQEIVNTLIIPAFREGDFHAGTDAAIDAVISELR